MLATSLPWLLPRSATARLALDLLQAAEMPPGTDPAGYLVSEKLDGVRAFWDGQQLRFRSGAVIAAPAWFLARLPARPLDGELWLGRGRFDALAATVRKLQPDDAAWRGLHYMVFELPGDPGPFEERFERLARLADDIGWPALQAVPQRRVRDVAALQQWLNELAASGGEGLMLHRADAPYQTGRSEVLLKFKPVQDADAVVVAHLPGRGRLAGLTGALQVRDEQGRLLQIGSGLTEAQRRAPPPVGSVVSFRWRGLTAHGLPRFATLLRVREPGW